MKKKTRILFLAIAAALICLVAYLNFERAAVYIFAKANGLEVTYRGVRRGAPGEFLFRDLAIVESKSGIGLRANEAKIRVSASGPALNGISLIFDMEEVNFIKAVSSESSFSDVEGLVSGAFSDNVKYEKLSGCVKRSGDSIEIKDLVATGDLMRTNLSGRMGRSGDINLDCVIYFSEQIKRKIPKEVSEIILKDDTAGWPSLSVHIEGDYKAPAINISGKHFRLNIREVVKR